MAASTSPTPLGSDDPLDLSADENTDEITKGTLVPLLGIESLELEEPLASDVLVDTFDDCPRREVLPPREVEQAAANHPVKAAPTEEAAPVEEAARGAEGSSLFTWQGAALALLVGALWAYLS